MKKIYLLLAGISLILSYPIAVRGQSVCLVKDIHPTVHSDPENLTDINGVILFTANNGTNGAELWRSDGTDAGTYMLKDIFPGSTGSSIDNFCKAGETLFFTAYDGTHGDELWKSDGTVEGTVLVKDIRPGSSGSSPFNLAGINGVLYFAAENNSSTGIELWKSDGTDVGTVLVKDINPGSGDGHPAGLAGYNGILYFSANDGTGGVEFWKSDGTEDGTALVKDINPTGSSYPSFLIEVNDILYFSASDGVHGGELWKSDGTEAGTALVKDINVAEGCNPFYLTEVNGTLFFRADDGSHGEELWKSDGTDAGTILVKDISPGSSSASLGNFYGFQGSLFFSAVSDVLASGVELWKTDGTAAGTVTIKEINPSGNSSPKNLTELNNILYFSATNGSNGVELWRTDGTEAGTYMVKDIYPGSALYGSSPTYFAVSGGSLFFAAADGSVGRELRNMVPAPSIPSSGVVFSGTGLTSMDLNWINGDGAGRIVLAKSGSVVDASPQNAVVYTADAEFGSGTELGAGNYVVYNGTGSSLTVTGLTNSTNYHFAVFEYNQAGCTAYLTSPNATGQESTLSATALPDGLYEDPAIILYPNPSIRSGKVRVDSPAKILSASVYSIQGNFIKALEVNNARLTGLSALEAGSYIILLETGNGTVLRKIILN